MYQYECSNCEERFEALRPMSERKSAPCRQCSQAGTQVITTVSFDPKMGLDPDFATFYSKWGKTRTALATGKMKDTNNSKLTGTDTDKISWENKNGRKAD